MWLPGRMPVAQAVTQAEPDREVEMAGGRPERSSGKGTAEAPGQGQLLPSRTQRPVWVRELSRWVGGGLRCAVGHLSDPTPHSRVDMTIRPWLLRRGGGGGRGAVCSANHQCRVTGNTVTRGTPSQLNGTTNWSTESTRLPASPLRGRLRQLGTDPLAPSECGQHGSRPHTAQQRW